MPHELFLVILLDLTMLNGLTHLEQVAHGLEQTLLLRSGETSLRLDLLALITRDPGSGGHARVYVARSSGLGLCLLGRHIWSRSSRG